MAGQKRVFALDVPAIHVFHFGAKDVDTRDIGAKQSFVASPGNDELTDFPGTPN